MRFVRKLTAAFNAGSLRDKLFASTFRVLGSVVVGELAGDGAKARGSSTDRQNQLL